MTEEKKRKKTTLSVKSKKPKTGSPTKQQQQQQQQQHQHHEQQKPLLTANFIEYNGTKLPFPKPSRAFNNNSEPLYCVCRSIDNGELMVGCDSCDDWYHFRCLKLNKKFEKLYYKYYCPYCEKEDPGLRSLYKKKCLLRECFNPISRNSKFCSRDHGIEYFKQIKGKIVAQQEQTEKLTKEALSSLTGGALNKASQLTINEVSAILQKTNDLTVAKLQTLGNYLPQVPDAEFAKFVELYNDNGGEEAYEESEYAAEQHAQEAELSHINKEHRFYKLKLEYLNNINEKVKIINDYLTSLAGGGDSAAQQQEKQQGSKKSKSKSKKKGPKKLEVCGYDKILSKTLTQWQHYLAHDAQSDQFFKVHESNQQQQEQEEKQVDKKEELCKVHVDNEDYFQDQLVQFKQRFSTLEQWKAYQEFLNEPEDEDDEDSDDDNDTLFSNLCLLERRKCQRHTGWQARVAEELIIRLNELKVAKGEVEHAKEDLKRRYVIEYWEQKEEEEEEEGAVVNNFNNGVAHNQLVGA